MGLHRVVVLEDRVQADDRSGIRVMDLILPVRFLAAGNQRALADCGSLDFCDERPVCSEAV
jgi:hypothetical protein